MDVKSMKRAARRTSRDNGTSYMHELNAIAKDGGYTHWGALAAATQNGCPNPQTSAADQIIRLADPEEARLLHASTDLALLLNEPPGSYIDRDFGTPKLFIPIDEHARDGKRQLLARRSTLAVAQWTGDMWAYPYGDGEDESSTIEQIDFEPTHYAPERRGAIAKA